MRTIIFAFVILLASVTMAMAGGADAFGLDAFRDKKVMDHLNKLLSGESFGAGAVCRTQAGMMRYFAIGKNVTEMNSLSDRLVFKTIKGATFSVPMMACDMYRNTAKQVAKK